MNIIVVSGGFDPIHSGHISYFNAAKELGDKLIVALNSDDWLINKKGKYFMPFKEREAIINSIECVDHVISFNDDDIGSCIDALEKVKCQFQILNLFLVLAEQIKRIHPLGFLKNGNTITRKEYGDPFLIYLRKSRLK